VWCLLLATPLILLLLWDMWQANHIKNSAVLSVKENRVGIEDCDVNRRFMEQFRAVVSQSVEDVF
jgi:uncharacterized protein (DUF1499 family)